MSHIYFTTCSGFMGSSSCTYDCQTATLLHSTSLRVRYKMLKPIVQKFLFLKVCCKTHMKHRLFISDAATNMTIVLYTVNGFEFFFKHNAQETGSVSTIWHKGGEVTLQAYVPLHHVGKLPCKTCYSKSTVLQRDLKWKFHCISFASVNTDVISLFKKHLSVHFCIVQCIAELCTF
jgi:hypothetical protein